MSLFVKENGLSQVSRTHPYKKENERIYKWNLLNLAPQGSDDLIENEN